MGFLDRIKADREAAKHERDERHRLEEAARQRQALEQAYTSWQERDAEMAELIVAAQTFEGVVGPEVPVLLKKGERAFMVGRGASLIEPRRPPGHWEGASTGMSFRVMKGVSYRVGQSRGHFVQDSERPTAIDQGTATITSQRVVFQGAKVAREWQFSKLLGVSHDPNEPWTALQVSNRQKVSGFLYDEEHAEAIRFRLTLALARYNDTVPELVADLQRQRSEHAKLASAQPRPELPS